jgi:integrase
LVENRMTRARDRQSASGLLPRMEARPWKGDPKKVTYRYHPVGGKPMNLGTDKGAAIQKVLDLTRRSGDEGTFAHLWRIYEDSRDFKRLADTTKSSYRECWGRAPGTKGPDDKGTGLAKVWARGVPSSIKPRDIARYLRVECSEGPVTANRRVAVLSNLFNVAVERGDIDSNPCREVRRNPESPRTRLVEAEEFAPFVAWALQQRPSDIVLVSMAEFAALSGNRRFEFRALSWPQIDEELIRLMRAKQRGGAVKRELLERSEAIDVVIERMRAQPGCSATGAVFRSPKTGNAYSESGFKTMWGRLMKRAIAAGVVKERFTFHDLRAHYTTAYKRRFGELPELHANPATTKRVYERSREVRRMAL